MQSLVPESRSYIHGKCGGVTEVTEGDFRNVAAPVPGMKATICSTCGRAFPISEFSWEDTSESITAYYERHRALVPGRVQLLCSRGITVAVMVIGLLIGIAVGVWSWNAWGAVAGIGIGLLSSLIVPIVGLIIWDRWTTGFLSRSLAVPDVRCLK